MKKILVFLTALWTLMLDSGWTACASSLPLFDVASKRVVPLKEAVARLVQAEVITVGEIHGRQKDHDAQLAIIEALHEKGRKVAVGLEMFQRRGQSDLDEWVAGKLSETEFESRFSNHWGMTWPFYRRIFVFCRDKRIPMVGLNVPREITGKVAREGFASLNPEELGLLPPITCRVSGRYTEIMRRAHGHAGMSDAAFTRFCEAQLVWDASMAVHAEEYLKGNAGTGLIILAGAVHAWREGIPEQLEAVNPTRKSLVILPESDDRFRKHSVTIEDCDYLIPES